MQGIKGRRHELVDELALKGGGGIPCSGLWDLLRADPPGEAMKYMLWHQLVHGENRVIFYKGPTFTDEETGWKEPKTALDLASCPELATWAQACEARIKVGFYISTDYRG